MPRGQIERAPHRRHLPLNPSLYLVPTLYLNRGGRWHPQQEFDVGQLLQWQARQRPPAVLEPLQAQVRVVPLLVHEPLASPHPPAPRAVALAHCAADLPDEAPEALRFTRAQLHRFAIPKTKVWCAPRASSWASSSAACRRRPPCRPGGQAPAPDESASWCRPGWWYASARGGCAPHWLGPG